MRQGVTPSDDPRVAPGTLHPLVCTHPDSGRRMLYLGRRRLAWIEGLDLPESEALLDDLWARATEPALCFTHQWQVGDLVLWDNRCTMHRPRSIQTRRGGSCTGRKSRAPHLRRRKCHRGGQTGG